MTIPQTNSKPLFYFKRFDLAPRRCTCADPFCRIDKVTGMKTRRRLIMFMDLQLSMSRYKSMETMIDMEVFSKITTSN